MKQLPRILVTGANGVLGYAAARYFAPAADCVLSGIEKTSATADELNLPYSIIDIADREKLLGSLDDVLPDIIVNCAAYTAVDGCETDPLSVRVNAEAPVTMAEWALENNALLVHYSTDYVFDGSKGPYREDDPVNPVNAYGRQKLASETGILDSGCESIILRTNVLFGRAPLEEASFLRFVRSSLTAGKTVNIVSDQYNNPTWSDDLAWVTGQLISQEARGLYHYGGADYLSRLEFALLIADVYGLNKDLILPVTTEELGLPAPRPLRGGLVNDRIGQFSGIPRMPLESILKIMKGDHI